ncbi:MAG TPA: biotin/lipoyl-containing protein [Candidatus Thermoplasmatota archaeon]|jgi:biotin carboxyl carrier protein|nr:biotin/lipoyl-containing protein [Candidatus Thermoplasmatota archaeon]
MHVVLEVDGERHELWLVRAADKVSVEVGGATHDAVAVARGAEVEVRLAGEVHRAEVLGPDRARIDGREVAFKVPFFAPGGAPGQHAERDVGSARIRPPMPGRVVAVRVQEGQQVEKGQVLLVLESMKMQNEILAPHGGRVARVACREGQLVEPSAVLVELEDR